MNLDLAHQLIKGLVDSVVNKKLHVIIFRFCFVRLSFLAADAAVGCFAVDDLVAAAVANVCGEVA